MISILIPIYNYSCRQLVDSLAKQCQELSIVYEIVCIDDASTDLVIRRENESISSIQGVKYTELTQNKGRQKIRALLASQANYSWLLFLDCDQSIERNFVARYFTVLSSCSSGLIYGGRKYSRNVSPEFYFRWLYGTKREQKDARYRAKHPYKTFMTNNFCISKDLFLSIPQDHLLQGYGYEDSFISYILKAQGIPIIHIDNPATHIGLEKRDKFLENTKNAMKNVSYLSRMYEIPKNHIQILDVLQTLHFFRIDGLILLILKRCMPLLNRNINGSHPNLFLFDLWKLHYLLIYFRTRDVS